MPPDSSIRRLYADLKIKHKLIVSITFILMLYFAFTFLTQQWAFSTYDEEIYDKTSQVLNLTSASIESELNKTLSVSFNVLADNQIQQYLMLYKNEPDLSSYDQLYTHQKITDLLLYYAANQKYVKSMLLINSQGGEHAVGNRVKLTDHKKQELINTGIQASGSTQWIYNENSKNTLMAVREIRSYVNLEFEHLGTLVVFVDIDKIASDLSYGLNAGQQGFMILSEEGTLFPAEPFLDLHTEPLTFVGKKGYQIEEINNQTYFVTHVHSDDTEWSYINVMPFNQIFERITLMKQLVIIALIIIFIVIIFGGLRFARSLVLPIEHLIEKMKHLQKGDFDKAEAIAVNDPYIQKDEFGLLHRNFRMMTQRINELIRENYKKQISIRETEFKALQAQINPHFLYNTLESINWLAKTNKQTQISHMVEALGFLLRNSVSLKEPLITINEEIQIVNHYVTIQTYRFEERLDFKLDIPDEFGACLIPKLTLQPLLENAIQYALEPMIDPCSITLTGRKTEQGLQLILEDNGAGIDPVLLDKINRGEHRSQGKGIGLTNIKERIEITFGAPYGIQVESKLGKGTRVIINLPLEKRD
jgi:two-component system sensor histidine kinase YesM